MVNNFNFYEYEQQVSLYMRAYICLTLRAKTIIIKKPNQ